MLDQFLDAFLGELDLFIARQSGFLALLGNQEALGDLHLFDLGVAREPDHFHAILQRRRDGVHHVGRGDEEYLAQVVLDVQVVIHEHVVLFRIENFQQRRRRVAAEVGRHLVDFVQHEHRVAHAGFLHHLENLSGQGADVGTPMAANFRFIPHAAQRQAHELASGGLGDGHP